MIQSRQDLIDHLQMRADALRDELARVEAMLEIAQADKAPRRKAAAPATAATTIAAPASEPPKQRRRPGPRPGSRRNASQDMAPVQSTSPTHAIDPDPPSELPS